jgi:hypothetical protein
MLKRCLEAGCTARTTATRCRTHQRQRDLARGTRQQRGYDANHDRLRAALLAAYDPVDPCPRCLDSLGPVPRLLDLGHVEGDRTRWSGLEHRECNRGQRRPARRSVVF